MGEEMKRLVCAAPPEHEGENLTSLFDRSLRCLDLYNARPEKDAMILVGILIGILFAIPVCLTTLVLWRRGFFFCGSSGPASFSRAFYKRTINEEIWTSLSLLRRIWWWEGSISMCVIVRRRNEDNWKGRVIRIKNKISIVQIDMQDWYIELQYII